jgi:hypothetical protein
MRKRFVMGALLLLAVVAATVAGCGDDDGGGGAAETKRSDRQIRVYLGRAEARELSPVRTSARVAGLAARVRRVAGQLDDGSVLALHSAAQPGARPQVIGGVRGRFPLDLARPVEGRAGLYEPHSQLYVATPAVLRRLGIDTVDPSTDFLADRTVPTDELVIPSMTRREEEFAVRNIQRKGSPRATGAPHGSGSRPACMTPRSCWPAWTSPTTEKRRGARRHQVWTRRTSSR